jgi:hypothetical protein
MSLELVIRYLFGSILGIGYGLWCFRLGQRSARESMLAIAKKELHQTFWRGHAEGMAEVALGLCASELPALREVGEYMVREGWVK